MTNFRVNSVSIALFFYIVLVVWQWKLGEKERGVGMGATCGMVYFILAVISSSIKVPKCSKLNKHPSKKMSNFTIECSGGGSGLLIHYPTGSSNLFTTATI